MISTWVDSSQPREPTVNKVDTGTLFLVGITRGLIILLSATTASSIAIAATTVPARDNTLQSMAEPFLAELKKPELAASRCMLSPVLATDNLTVAVSADRVFATGDVILAVGNDVVDVTAKMPVRDILAKHGPDESIALRIRRAGKEAMITAKCGDAKSYVDRLLEATYAASHNDAAGCADKMRAAFDVHRPGFYPMFLSFQCNRLAGRIVGTVSLGRAYYEVYQELILESAWSPDALNHNRANILAAVEVLSKNNEMLANDLKEQLDQAVVSARSATTTVAAQ
jgi:hypothetical protein